MTDKTEEVKLRSYLIWESEGRPDGASQDHWLRAEAELASEQAAAAKPAKARSPRTSAPKTGKAKAAKSPAPKQA
ncbi:MAG: DUF2934 domain-containing protein [Sphingomonadales bacterium]|nr:DUF2934 domain-containing protein [Sphingomonadales bacterium]MBU3993674.1 DUF2934 domain-containing protein [Alphaproteobacteria bacterium]